MGRPRNFNDHPFPYHAELELDVTTLTNLGSGLGRVALPAAAPGAAAPADPDPAPAGGGQWVVMVPFALPGERVRVRVWRNHRNFSEADLLAVLTPSPHRVAAPCALFGQCGGCQYQHLAYPEQLAWKRRQVAELLTHLAGVTFPVAPVVGSPRAYGYRSKLTPHFQVGRSGRGEETAATPIGFLRPGSRFDLIDVPACPLATPGINARLTEVRAETRARLRAGAYVRGATLLLRHAQEGVITDYDAVIHETIAPDPADANGRPLRLEFLARDFFQNNPFLLPAFTAYVRAQAAAGGARFLADTYCGSGLFALACAPAFTRVAGIELSASAVRFATANAAANGVTNATFQTGEAARIFAGLDFPAAETAVVIDPPRKGCDPAFLEQLLAYGPRTVVYVSCDPATQMRDLRAFLAAGYALTAVQPFDLFPQTRHLECVLTLAQTPPPA